MCKIEKTYSCLAPLPGAQWTTYGLAFVNGVRVATIEKPRGRDEDSSGNRWRVWPDGRHWVRTFRTLAEARAYCDEIARA